jgi:hypothetical protein
MKYMVITAYGKDWQSKALVFESPREAAKAWLKYDMGIRLLIDGEIHHGTYEQMRPLHNEIAQLSGGAE